MHSYKVIREVSQAIRTILWHAFETDPEIRTLIDTEADIVFKTPTETTRDSTNRLSLWLYHIGEDEHIKNRPMLRAQGTDPQLVQWPPLALNLSYLVTPFGLSHDADHLLLGRTMQVLYDNASFLIKHDDEDVAEELRLIFCSRPLAEMTQIWQALQAPYRLSVCYQVRVVRIESERRIKQPRVVEQELKGLKA